MKEIPHFHFWAQRLGFSASGHLLLKLLRGCRVTLTFIELGLLGKILIPLARQFFAGRFTLNAIEQRLAQAGPKLNLASVRNDRGEVITIDIFHHIMRLRLKIVQRILADFHGLAYLDRHRGESFLPASLGMAVARDITPTVYMANYARWKPVQGGMNSQTCNILIIPDSPWRPIILEELREFADKILFSGRFWRVTEWIAYGSRYLKVLLQVILSKALRGTMGSPEAPRETARAESPDPGPVARGKIMTIYRLGVMEEERNDIPFFHASGIPADRMLVYIKYPHHLPNDQESEYLRRSGFSVVVDPKLRWPQPWFPTWQPTGQMRWMKREVQDRYLRLVRDLRRYPYRWVTRLAAKIWEMENERVFWRDFFQANGIKILVSSAPAGENFAMNWALSETGGIGTAVERSILFDYCTFIHNSPNHVNFITGPYSETQIPEPSYSIVTVQAGALNVTSRFNSSWSLSDRGPGKKKVVALFDEIPNDWFFGNSIRELYTAMIALTERNPSVILLVKTKKPQILSSMVDIKEKIEQLIRGGRCRNLDWKISISDAAFAADMVVCAPSTAAFESVMRKTPTIVYNPMKSGSRVFYRNEGLNRRIFEDMDMLLRRLDEWLAGQGDGVGDCSDLERFLDPFLDGGGSSRIGTYLRHCLERMEGGDNREQAICFANARYRDSWGEGRVSEYPCPGEPS